MRPIVYAPKRDSVRVLQVARAYIKIYKNWSYFFTALAVAYLNLFQQK